MLPSMTDDAPDFENCIFWISSWKDFMAAAIAADNIFSNPLVGCAAGSAWDFVTTLQGTCAAAAGGPPTMEAQDWGGNGLLDDGERFR